MAGEALYAYVEQPAQGEAAAVVFRRWADGAAQLRPGPELSLDEREKYCIGVVPLPPSDEFRWSLLSGTGQ